MRVQSSRSVFSSIRSLCSTDHRLRAHQRKAGSRTVFRLSPQQIAEQSCNRRVRRHRLGWESPWAVLRSVSCLGQFVQKLIPQLGALRLISQQKPDLGPCPLRPSLLLWIRVCTGCQGAQSLALVMCFCPDRRPLLQGCSMNGRRMLGLARLVCGSALAGSVGAVFFVPSGESRSTSKQARLGSNKPLNSVGIGCCVSCRNL